MPDFGMPTLIELPEFEDCAKLCREFDFNFVELNMCLPQYQPGIIDECGFRRAMEKYGIYITVHLDDANTPCDFNPRIAEAYTATTLDAIDTAKRLAIPTLTMHLSAGPYFTLPERKVYLFEQYRELYYKKLTEFRDRCTRAIGDFDTKICVENTSAYNSPMGEESLGLLLESPAFALTFDTGHDACRDFTHRKIVEKQIDRLTHMHLHDAKSAEKRDHLPLGEGELDLDEYLALAEAHNCRVVVEVKTIAGLKKSREWLAQKAMI